MLLTSCLQSGGGGGAGSSGGASNSDIGLRIVAVSGDNQFATPSANFAQPLVVKVTTPDGIAVPSAPVEFEQQAASATGILSSGLVSTDASGIAQATFTAPGTSNLTLTIKAKLQGSEKFVLFTLTVRTYPATPTLTLKDPVTLSTQYAQQTLVGLDIVDDGSVAKWCVSETQTSRPPTGSSACTGGEGSSTGWHTSRPTSLTLTTLNGAKTVYIWVADNFGQVNQTTATGAIFLDTVKPGTPSVQLSDTDTGSTTDTDQASTSLTIGNDGDASYWCVKSTLNTDPAPANPARNDACWTTVEPTSVILSQLGLSKVYVWTKDLAENISVVAGSGIINFTTGTLPDPTIGLSDPNTNSTTYARQREVNISIGNDASATRWCISEQQNTRPTSGSDNCTGGAGPVSGWSLTRPSSYTLSAGDGLKTVYVWLANAFNNTSSGIVTDAITLDTTPPAIPLADLTDPNTGQPNFTNQSTVTLSITSDTDAVAWCTYEMASNASPPSLPTFNNVCWVGTRPTQALMGALGTRRVYVYTKDIAQNVSPAPGVAMITYTTTAPSNPVGVLRDVDTNSSTLAKSLTANLTINSPSGTVRWCVSETQNTKPTTGSDTCNGGAGPSSGWYTASPSTFTLSSADGLKTVYLWVADGANNVNSTVATTTITLDRTDPATPNVVISDPNSGSVTDTNQIIPSLAITADTDAYRWCRVIQDTVSAAPAKPALNDTCWVIARPTNVVLDTTGTRKLYLFTRDEAGNVGTAGSTTINYSTDNPGDPSLTLADVGTALTAFANQGNVNLNISNDADATKWCISETQTTRPSLGTSACNGGLGASNGWFVAKPSTRALSAGNGLKRVYVWTANATNSVNANPSSATITRDEVLPSTPIVGLSDPNTASVTQTNQSTVLLNISGEDVDVTAWCVIEQATAAAAPTTPAWNHACFTTSKPVNVNLTATGNRKVYVYFRDTAYNVSAAAGAATINYNITAPATPSLALTDPTTTSASYARQTAVNVSITGDTGATKWCISETQNTKPSLGTSTCAGGTGASNGWHTARPTTFTLSSSDASKTVYVWTANVSNTVSATAATATITLDTLPSSVPFITLSDSLTSSTTVTNQASVNLDIQFDTDATNWCVIEQAFATAVPGQPAYNHGCWVAVRPTTVTLGATGVRRVFVFTKDVAQNVSSSSGVSQINYTTTPPSDPVLSLSNSTTGTTTVTKDTLVTVGITSPTGTVKWCLSETQNTKPASGSSTCTGGAGPSSGWYVSLPSTFTLSNGEGLKTVYVWVSDSANNVNANASSASITLDTTVPATPTVAMADPNTTSTTKTNQFSVNLSVTSDTDAYRWCPIIQANAAAAPSAPSLSDSCWKTSRPTTQLIDATGVRKLYLFTRDEAGNIGAAGTTTMDYSLVSPADPTVSLAHTTTGLSDYAKSTSTALTISGDTNATKWCVSESQSTKPSLGTSACSGGTGPTNGWFTVKPTTFTLSSTDALKRVYVWTADDYNNVNASSSSATITLDTVEPLTPSVSLSDVNTNSATNTNQSTVNINIGSTADGLAWCVIEQADATAAPSTPAYNDVCFATSKPTTQSLGATGLRKAYVFTRDRAYNVSSTPGVATITYVTTAPSTPTLALSDATTSSTSYIRQTAVSVSIGNDATATKWCVSESQTSRPALGTSACNGGSGASNGWYTARPTSFTTSSAEGSKTIYVRTADISNNTSAASSTASITLDTIAPAIPVASLSDPNTANTAFTNQSAVNVSITDDTDATKWCVMEQAAATAAPAKPLFNDGCFVGVRPTGVTLGATGTRRIYLYTQDNAGNISSAASTATISYSLAAPTDPGLVLTNATTGSRFYTNVRAVSASINNPAGTVRWCLSETQSSRPANGSAACNGGAGGDNGWYTSMPSSFTLSSGDALKTVYIWVADASNNTNSNQSSTTITLIENALPAPTVALADPNTTSSTNTNQNNINMTITSDTGANAWCSIVQDAAAGAPSAPSSSDTCWLLTRPTTVSLGATGSRKVYVFLRDPAMNVSPPGDATILLSTAAPADPTLALAHSTTSLSTYAKNTSLNVTVGNDATATRWCVSEAQSVKPNLGTSTCVGGAGPSNGWYSARPTAFSLSAGDGSKRVYVWVANVSNNVSENAVSQSIILDTANPGTFNIAGATGGTDLLADAYLGTTTTPTISWSASSGAANYLVSITNTAGNTVICPEVSTTATTYTFAGCTLVDGTDYKAVVIAEDEALNSTPAANTHFAFHVTLSPPGTFTISGITGSQDTTADEWSGTTLPTVTWTASTGANSYKVRIFANDGVTVLCSLQTKASGVLSHDYSTTGCSGVTDNTLYKAEVTAYDIAANSIAATNSVFIFRTDVTAPSVNISANPAAQSIVTTANFTFSGSDTISGIASMLCKLDAGAFAACDSSTAHALTGLSNGNHTFTVKSVDKVGLSTTSSFTWDIDTVAPAAFTITGATGTTDSTADAFLRNDTVVTANWNDSTSEDSYEVSILNNDNSVACPMVVKAQNATSHTFTGCNLAASTNYKIKVVAKRGYGTSYDPGAMSFATVQDSLTATITASSNSLISGNNVTLTIVTFKEGVQMTTPDATPTLTQSGGTSTGTFGAVSYTGSGTYTATFTGITAGTARTISATTGYLSGFTGVTTTDLTVGVAGVSTSIANSPVTVSKSTILADNTDTSTVTATVRDLNNNPITGATLSAIFEAGAGNSTGTITAFTETPASSGIYVATINGVYAGSATKIIVTANGSVLLSQPTVDVNPGAPVKILVTGVGAINTHTCSGPYEVTLNDYHNNEANAQSNVVINFSGITSGIFSQAADCSTSMNQATILLGGTRLSPIYIISRGTGAITLSFADNASTNPLTTGTRAVNVTGTLAWLGTSGQLAWGATTGYASRSSLDGMQEPRGLWYDGGDLIYVADTNNHRIIRYNKSTQTLTGWIGRVDSVEGMTCPGYPVPGVSGVTPAWCTGGAAQALPGSLTNWNGMMSYPNDVTGDATYLYVLDRANHRILRYNQSTGVFAGWIGRISGTLANVPSSCDSGTPAQNIATPDWCYGGTSQASTGAANMDGMFNFGTDAAIRAFTDGTTGHTILLVVDSGNHRIVRYRLNRPSSPGVEFQGWAGRPNTGSFTNGYNTTGCDTAPTTAGSPGWCKGGVTQASPASTNTPSASFPNYDNMFSSPRSLAVVSGTPSIAYMIDRVNGRIVKFNIDTGKTISWTGRATIDYPGGGGGTNCTTENTHTGWCTGGVPVNGSYCRSTFRPACNVNGWQGSGGYIALQSISLDVDSNYIYVALQDNGTRDVRRFPLADGFSGVSEWIGRVNSSPTGGVTGCQTTPLGFATPGWCIGGGSRAGITNGHVNSPIGVLVDPTNDVLYVTDNSANKIQMSTLSSGAPAGWIGAKANAAPQSWSTNYTAGLLGNHQYNNEESSFSAGLTGTTTLVGAGAVLVNSGKMYIADTSNHRIKKLSSSTGSYEGWYGRTNGVPTGGDDIDACTSIASGALTPTWCTGAASQVAAVNGSGQLNNPRGLAADNTYLYIADSSLHRIVRLTKSTAAFSGWIGRNNTVTAGNLFGFDTASTNQCQTVGAATFTGAWCFNGDHASNVTADGQMNAPRGISIDTANNRLFVAESGNHRISVYNVNNVGATMFQGWLGRGVNSFAAANAATGSNSSDALCQALNNSATTAGFCIGGRSQSGNLDTQAFSGFNTPSGVAFASSAIFVADTSNNKVHKFHADTGQYLGWIGKTATSKPNLAGTGSGIADADCSTNLTLGNATPGFCSRGGSTSGNGDNMFSAPHGIWADPNDSYFYVVDAGNFRVTRHDKTSGAFAGWKGVVGTVPTAGGTTCTSLSAGDVTPTWCYGGTAQSSRKLGGFYNPLAISGDASFLYVTDTLNNRVVAVPK